MMLKFVIVATLMMAGLAQAGEMNLGNVHVTYPDGDVNLVMSDDTLIINSCVVDLQTGESVGICNGVKVENSQGESVPSKKAGRASQTSTGACSPNIGSTKGSVNITISGCT